MTNLFVGNFHFEHSLAERNQQQLSNAERWVAEDLAGAWIALANPGDLVWTPQPFESAFAHDLEVVGLPALRFVDDPQQVDDGAQVRPWGWTQSIVDWAASFPWRCELPDLSVVRQANSRSFSFESERDLGIGLPNSYQIGSMDELEHALTKLTAEYSTWVLKAEFSMSARERILGSRASLSEAALNWAKKRLAWGGAVFLEPWVERLNELGIQFSIPKSGEPTLVGVAPLLTDAGGAYCGSRLATHVHVDDNWTPAIESATHVAEVLQGRGYFGPLGIDAMRYRDADGEIRLRPLQDVNARYTMGRLALGFRRLLRAGEFASWLHVRWGGEQRESAKEWFEQALARIGSAARVIRTSPFQVGGRATRHGTLLLIADSQPQVQAAESIIMEAKRI